MMNNGEIGTTDSEVGTVGPCEMPTKSGLFDHAIFFLIQTFVQYNGKRDKPTTAWFLARTHWKPKSTV